MHLRFHSKYWIALSVAIMLGTIAASGSLRRTTRTKSPSHPQSTLPGSRAGASSTLMPDGRLLILGGEGPAGPVSSATFRDPSTGVTKDLAASLHYARAWHTSTLLPDGIVLVAGGTGADGRIIEVAELFDPQTEGFHDLKIIGITPRSHHTATVLTSGLVFFAGGLSTTSEVLGVAELWDFRANKIERLSSGLLTPRQAHTATLLADGTVLLWGGADHTGTNLNYGEVFDPGAQRFRMETAPVSNGTSSDSPQLEASIPQDRDADVPVDALISFRFSEPLLVQAVSPKTVTLSTSESTSEQAILAKVIPAEAGMLAFVMPQAALLPGTTYSVTVSGAIDPHGRPLPDTSLSFTTAGSAPQTGGETGIPFGTGNSSGSNSNMQNLQPLQAPPGVTALAGQSLLLDGEPLDHLTLRLDDKTTTMTDGTGRFLLKNISAGHHSMIIDGRSAHRDQQVYGVFEVGVDIVAGKTNVLDYTIWMTALDTSHAVHIPFPTSSEVVITNPNLPGLEFHLPPNATVTDSDGNVAQEISITPIPISQPPFPLPKGVRVPVYFTIQPGGGYISVQSSDGPKGGRLIYPNAFNFPAGTRFDFWNYDPDNKGWFIYGHGNVSKDRKSVIPDPGVEIYQLSGAMADNPGGAAGNGPNPGDPKRGGDPVDLGTGLFVYNKTDLFLPDVITISLRRTYRQNDNIVRAFGIGSTHDYDIFLVTANPDDTRRNWCWLMGGESASTA